MSRRRGPRRQQLSRAARSDSAWLLRNVGLQSAWCAKVKQAIRCHPPGERNGLYGARCVPKQKIGEFEQARGIEPQSQSERQVMKLTREKTFKLMDAAGNKTKWVVKLGVKHVGFGNEFPDLTTPLDPHPSDCL